MTSYSPPPKMREDVRDAWVEAWLNPANIVGRGFMARRMTTGEIARCPLGVLCDLGVTELILPPPKFLSAGGIVTCGSYWDAARGTWETSILPLSVVEWAHLKESMPRVMVLREDRERWNMRNPLRFPKDTAVPVRLNAVNDFSDATREEIAGLIRTL